ncbi:MAG: peptidylprolyl isomerase [Candidatus Micrarchaeota archaeon]
MVNEGDFVLLDYPGKTKEGKVFDTTSSEEAKKAGIFNEKAKYGPVLVVAGKKQVLPGLDDALLTAVPAMEKTVEVLPDKAFGTRNLELVKLVPIGRFKDQHITPFPGMVLDFDGNMGKISSVEGGRVSVDFNHPLAGQTVTYTFKIVKAFFTPAEKVQAIASDAFPVGVTSQLVADAATFTADAAANKGADFIVAKMRAIQMLLQYVPEIKKVVFNEEYTTPDNLA